MDNYIVRIFRRDDNDPDKISGLVEIVAEEKQRVFSGCDELREILSPTEKLGGQSEKKKAGLRRSTATMHRHQQ